MTTTVAADNTVKNPDALAQLLDLKPGTALEWQVSGPGSLLARQRPRPTTARQTRHHES